jgi:dihydroxyacetone kinase-like protein
VSAEVIPASIGRAVTERFAKDIGELAGWLSELDGTVGDGDHGVNMRTGIELALTRVEADASVSDALRRVGETLLEDIGGAMGPLYGVFFLALADACTDRAWIDVECLRAMLADGAAAVIALGGAQVGDKTLVDVLVPTLAEVDAAVAAGSDLRTVLRAADVAAQQSRDATKEMVAKLGRAARAGERSRGQIDAGAASCALIVAGICSVFAENVQTHAMASQPKE